jgi:hypothetical protein
MPPGAADVAIHGARPLTLYDCSWKRRDPSVKCATSSSCRRHDASQRSDRRPPVHHTNAAYGRPARGSYHTEHLLGASRSPEASPPRTRQAQAPSCSGFRPDSPTPARDAVHRASPVIRGVTAPDDRRYGDAEQSTIASSHPPRLHMAFATCWQRPTEGRRQRLCHPSHDCFRYHTLRVCCPHLPPAGTQRTKWCVPDRLPWGFVPYDAFRNEQRPTPGLPRPTALRLQVFSTS